LESSLLLFFTGAAHNSWKLLQEQKESTKKQIPSTVDSLHQIRELADQMRSALLKGDLRVFGALLHEGWEAKKRISSRISNPLIDEAYAAARRNGALGGKIAGAGGGGFLLLFCQEQHQEKVREAMAKLELREMAFELDSGGAEVVVNDPFVDGDEKCGGRWTFIPGSASWNGARPFTNASLHSENPSRVIP
jgi:D-glycero-alpha-D-manno-heptose-7-phosphate kinase